MTSSWRAPAAATPVRRRSRRCRQERGRMHSSSGWRARWMAQHARPAAQHRAGRRPGSRRGSGGAAVDNASAVQRSAAQRSTPACRARRGRPPVGHAPPPHTRLQNILGEKEEGRRQQQLPGGSSRAGVAWRQAAAGRAATGTAATARGRTVGAGQDGVLCIVQVVAPQGHLQNTMFKTREMSVAIHAQGAARLAQGGQAAFSGVARQRDTGYSPLKSSLRTSNAR